MNVDDFSEFSPHSKAGARCCSYRGCTYVPNPPAQVHLPPVERGHLLFDPSTEGGPRQNQRAAELKAWMPVDLRPVRRPAAIVHV
jgi:hypothetical protein